jgi:hypothetical protein
MDLMLLAVDGGWSQMSFIAKSTIRRKPRDTDRYGENEAFNRAFCTLWQ